MLVGFFGLKNVRMCYKKSSIMYVNYVPYGNAGHILDYLKENFDDLIYVSFVFHPVERSSTMQVYHKGKLVKNISMPTLLAPKNYVHHLAPLLSIITAIELIAMSVYVFLKFKIKPQIFLAPNAFLIFIGIILRALSFVDKAVFWVWDYYPIPKAGSYRKLFYRLYWVLDRWCTYKSDFLWYISCRLLKIREKLGVFSTNDRYLIVPLGVKLIDKSILNTVQQSTLGFIGMLKKSQGIELIINSLSELAATISDIKVEVIGSGPDMEYFKTMVGQSLEGYRVFFHGFIGDGEKQQRIIASWTAAAALYVPTDSNLSAYADPNKVKLYLECGTPVIITKVPAIAEEIHLGEAGIAIEYNTKELVSAVTRIFAENDRYRKNAMRLAHKYDYKKIYDNAFSIMAKRLWPNQI